MREGTKLYWHVHHGVLVEPLTEPIEKRIKYINEFKPKNERALRLQLLKPVKGQLPQSVVQTWQAYTQASEAADKAWEGTDQTRGSTAKAWEAYDQARHARNQARQAHGQALQAHQKEIEALHKIECPNCPWNGETIFNESHE